MPFVFASPHSGRAYPDTLLAASRLDATTLRRSEDAFVDELFAAATSLGAPLLAAGLRITQLPADWLDPYWPEDVAKDTRAWVVPNIPAGMVDEAGADLVLRLPIDGEGTTTQSVKGHLKTSDLTVHYLRPMPPITKGVATAEFDGAGGVASKTRR